MDTVEITDSKAPSSEVNAAADGFGRKRLTINTLASMTYYVLLMLVGLWYTPYMIHKLPESVYGLIPLASSLTTHLTIVMTMIASPVCRYVIAELARGDVQGANETFNTFVFGGAKVIAVMTVFIGLFCWWLPVKVPPGYETEAKLLFGSIGVSFLLSSFVSCFESGYWISNRFEFKSLVEISVVLLRNGLVVLLFQFSQPDLWQVSVAVFAAASYNLFAAYLAWRKLAPQLRLDHHLQTPDKKKLLYSVGRWLMAMHVGNQLLVSSDLFLINRFFGSAENAKYGILLMWASILRSLFGQMGQVLLPTLITLEAQQGPGMIMQTTKRTVRFVGTAAVCATGILTGMALPLLTIWIRKPWVHEIAPLAGLIMLPLTFELCSGPTSALLFAPERVKLSAIASIACGVLAVGLSLVLLFTTDWGFYSVAVSTAVALTVRHAILNPIIAMKGLPGPWHHMVTLMASLTLRFALAAAVSYLVERWLAPHNWQMLLAGLAISTAIILPVTFFTMPGDDRKILTQFVLPKTA